MKFCFKIENSETLKKCLGFFRKKMSFTELTFRNWNLWPKKLNVGFNKQKKNENVEGMSLFEKNS